MSAIRDEVIGYLETVVRVEWPAQAEGQIVDRGRVYLEKLNRTAIGLKPASAADGNLQAQLLQSLSRLWDARAQRLLSAETTIPAVVWVVTLVGAVSRLLLARLRRFDSRFCDFRRASD
jgi:hypothetical protein